METAAPHQVLRFTRTERAVHWVQAGSFLLLLVTGFSLGLPAIEGLFGHRELLRQVHLTGAFLYALGPMVIALGANRASVARDVHEVEVWTEEDLHWLIPGSESSSGRFNAGQKLNAIFVAWCTVAFTLTGFIMWQNRRFPLDVVSRANTIHTDLAYIALAVFLGHIFLATTWPRTRGAFPSMIRGTVGRDWARDHHPEWLPDTDGGAAPSAREILVSTLHIALGWFAALFAARFLFFLIGANVTDGTTRWLYDVTAWPGTASIAPQTGVHLADWPALIYLAVLIAVWKLVSRRKHGVSATSFPTP
jgi:formate dehydrogenase subunit gamma